MSVQLETERSEIMSERTGERARPLRMREGNSAHLYGHAPNAWHLVTFLQFFTRTPRNIQSTGTLHKSKGRRKGVLELMTIIKLEIREVHYIYRT